MPGAVRRKHPHRSRVEEPRPLKIHRSAGERAVDRGQALGPRKDRGPVRMLEVRVDEIIEVGFADRLARRVLVGADIDGREPLLAVRLEQDPEMRIGRGLRGRHRVNLAAQALIIDVGHHPSLRRALSALGAMAVISRARDDSISEVRSASDAGALDVGARLASLASGARGHRGYRPVCAITPCRFCCATLLKKKATFCSRPRHVIVDEAPHRPRLGRIATDYASECREGPHGRYYR